MVREKRNVLAGGKQNEAYKSPGRRTRDHSDRDQKRGIRLAPLASGAETNSVAPIRELMGFLQTRGQFGYSPTMHADVMVYRIAEIAASKCDAGKSAPAGLEGTAPEGHDATKTEVPQRAKAGYCLRCARATCAAIPSRRKLREYRRLKGRGLALRMSDGSRAARRLAACQYVKAPEGTASPKTWHLAAQYWDIVAPDPLVRMSSLEAPLRAHAYFP